MSTMLRSNGDGPRRRHGVAQEALGTFLSISFESLQGVQSAVAPGTLVSVRYT